MSPTEKKKEAYVKLFPHLVLTGIELLPEKPVDAALGESIAHDKHTKADHGHHQQRRRRRDRGVYGIDHQQPLEGGNHTMSRVARRRLQ
jgi:hypothetical protein